jgi:hypothetical protein
MVKLAEAFNDRICSGVGDPVYRIAWAVTSIFRNIFVGTPDSYVFDFFHFDARRNALQSVPGVAANTPGGLNSNANPLAAWSIGSGIINVDEPIAIPANYYTYFFTSAQTLYKNEDGRHGAVAAAAADNFQLAARQRGAILATDLTSPVSPFRTYAEAHAVADYSQSGNGFNDSYGGKLPTPPLDTSDGHEGNCNDLVLTGESPYWKFLFRFNKLTAGAPTGPELAFWTGTELDFGNMCPEPAPPVTPGQVTSDFGALPYILGFTESATAYRVIMWNGTTEDSFILPKSDYIFILDGDGKLQRDGLEIAARTSNWIVNRLRGAESERTTDAAGIPNWDITKIAFDVDRYFTTQNRLAPAYAIDVGGGTWQADYRRFQFGGATIAGTLATNVTDGGTSYTHDPNFVPAGIYAVGTGLTGSVSITMKVNGAAFHSFTLTTGAPTKIQYFDTPTAGALVEFELNSAAPYTQVEIQIADLLEEKGSFDQLAALLRSGTSGTSYAIDGQPDLTDIVNIVSDSYFNDGVMIQPGAGPRNHTQDIEDCALFDGARMMAKSFFSACGPQEFNNISSDGANTTMSFKRYVDDSDTLKKDIFSDILPAEEVPSGKIKPGIRYALFNTTGGAAPAETVTYDGTTYAAGTSFEGKIGETDYVVNGASTFKVYQYEGIFTAAPALGFTAEWVLMVNTMLRDNLGTLPSYQLADYALNYPLVNRCVVGSPNASSRQKFFARDTLDDLYKPEFSSAYNYDENINPAPSDDFYSSCRVYPKPYKILSVVHGQSTVGGPLNRVTLILDGNLHKHPGADAVYSADSSTWNVANLNAETFRTDENAVREWQVTQEATGASTFKTGDSFTGGPPPGFNPANGGARVPQFYFAKLIPKPVTDGNSELDEKSDSVFEASIWPQIEFYLRVMCEGYVDTFTTENDVNDCTDAGINYDFNFENLMIQATGQPWLSPVPAAQNPDQPRGFGNHPRQAAWAEVFNNAGKAINLLTSARLEIDAFTIERQAIDDLDIEELFAPDVNDGVCTDDNVDVLQTGYTPANPTTNISTDAWVPLSPGDTTITFESIANINTTDADCPVSNNQAIRVRKDWGNIRGNATDVNALNALDSDLVTHIQGGGVGFLAKKKITNVFDTITPTVGPGGPGKVSLDGNWYLITNTTAVESEECLLINSATGFDPGAPPAGDFYRLDNTTNESRRTISLTFSASPPLLLSFDLV